MTKHGKGERLGREEGRTKPKTHKREVTPLEERRGEERRGEEKVLVSPSG
jgi:hypothetical protein